MNGFAVELLVLKAAAEVLRLVRVRISNPKVLLVVDEARLQLDRVMAQLKACG
jgi:hypothetical protein